MHFWQKGEKKGLEFGVFRPRLTSNPIQKTNPLEGLKNALFRFSGFLPHPSFFSAPFSLTAIFSPSVLHLINIGLSCVEKKRYLCRVKKKDHHIQNLILEGEHQMLDFKFEISDSRRIARSLAAFANTDGGRLLVGVKDNGAIAGVRSDEEIHMIQAAAEMYCQPKVEYTTEEWEINGKTVLEVIIPKDKHHKHKAPDNQGNYKIFVRVKDENLVADSVLIKVWKSDKFAKPAKISFTETETLLLHYLTEHEEITLQEFQEIAHINKRRAEAILADFILVGTIELVQTSQNTVFRLTQASEIE